MTGAPLIDTRVPDSGGAPSLQIALQSRRQLIIRGQSLPQKPASEAVPAIILVHGMQFPTKLLEREISLRTVEKRGGRNKVVFAIFSTTRNRLDMVNGRVQLP
jgi:hypothetical protein